MPDSVLSRRGLIAGGAGAVAGSAVVVASAAPAAARGVGRLSGEDVAAILNLKANYAYGSDLITSGAVEEGRARYAATFTSPMYASAAWPGKPPVLEATSVSALVDAVVAGTADAIGGQHLLGTIEIVPGGGDDDDDRHWWGKARVTAYVQATLVFDTFLVRALATYRDVAVRTFRGWRLSESRATYLSVETATPTALDTEGPA